MRVLHPMGYDAFGLPAENHAIKTGQHPRESTDESIAEFQQPVPRVGDLDRLVARVRHARARATTAGRSGSSSSCSSAAWPTARRRPSSGAPTTRPCSPTSRSSTGAASAAAHEVEVRQLEQWFFRITDYADRLLDDLDTIEWPEHVKTMQRNWIGRSEGAEVTFRCEELGIDYPVFTTRPDTLFGATFFVMAPEHPDVFRLAAGTEHEQEVRTLRQPRAERVREERGDADKREDGRPARAHVINPVNGEQIPMFVADYVLMEYGTGAIMAVPAPRRSATTRSRRRSTCRSARSSAGGDDVQDEAYTGDGPLVNSGPRLRRAAQPRGARARSSSGSTARARATRRSTTACATGCSRASATGAARSRSSTASAAGSSPCPRTSCRSLLPDVEDYAPKGRSPLAAAEDWVNARARRCGGPARRETDTMDTFVDSSWYFLRYCDAAQRRGGVGPDGRSRSGCRSTSTSAASSTRSCTCCTRASSPRRSPTWATSTSRSRSRGCSPRG